VRTPDRYIEAVGRGDTVEAASETLDAGTRRFERLELALRTRDGVPSGSFSADTLELLEGMLERHPSEPDQVVLTRAGRLMANDIAARLL
jgi:oxygen-independent coproporphyrinogen-3 oxidase